MDNDELRQLVIENAIEMTRQWRGIEALVDQGKLAPRPGGWYELTDFSALESINRIVESIQTNSDSHLPPRVRVTQPNAKMVKLADENSD